MSLKTIFFIALLSLGSMTALKGQNFMMSSVNMMPGTSSNATAMNFKSSATCIDVQSGIAVFSGARNSGEFAINCTITQVFNTLGLKLFPNPVVSKTKVKFTNTPPLTETFIVSVWNTDGVMISSKKESGYNIFQGMMLDASNLVSGGYVLRVESSQYLDAIKFIKVY